METLFLDGTNGQDVAQAATLLRAGQLVAFPTDTVYGVGALPFSASAVAAIYTAKERLLDKGIPILLGQVVDWRLVAQEIPEEAQILMMKHWPGALTVIVPKLPTLPANLSPNSGIALRVPNHPLACELITAAGGALAVTSANRSGEPAAQTAVEAFEALNGRVAAVLDGGTVTGGTPSTIVQLINGRVEQIRPGPIKIETPPTN